MCERCGLPVRRRDAVAALATGLTFAAFGGVAGAAPRPLRGRARTGASEHERDRERRVRRRIAPHVWVHTTLSTIAGEIVPANGMLVERERDAVLVDTGWEPRQTSALLAWSSARGKPVAAALVTHFHADRIGGIAALDAVSIPISANPLTIGLAMEHGYDAPDPLVGVDAGPQRFAEIGEAFFPGAGHTRDNLTLALADRTILFGGCLIRSIAAPTLGNVEDAVLADWDASLRALQMRYRSATIVVPGHGKIGGDPIGHTLNLLAASGHGV